MKALEHYCKSKINFTGAVYIALIAAAIFLKQA